jgi:hypothetical protein
MMIKLNTPYTIENGDIVTFEEGKNGTINGAYTDSTLTGIMEGNLLKATFHNKKVNVAGLIEITFHENGFNAKWKSGLEPGPMRGKWEGSLTNNGSTMDSIQSDSDLLSDEQKLYLENGVTLEDFDEEYQGDSEGKVAWMKEKAFVMEAILQDERILKFASDDLKADREVVTLVVEQNAESLRFADEKLQCDPEINLTGIKSTLGNEESLSLSEDDLNIFINDTEYYDPVEPVKKLSLKVTYAALNEQKEEFDRFHGLLKSMIHSQHECFWLLQVVDEALIKAHNIAENNAYFFDNEKTKAYYDSVSTITSSFNFDLEFSPNKEYDTYFIDTEINSNWDEVKWADTADGEGQFFTEFIMQRAGINWDDDSWNDKKFYNHAISSLWIGLQNYSLRHLREGMDEENTAVALYSVIDEKYEPIRESGCADYGIYTFHVITQYLLSMSRNDYDLNETDREDLEEFNGWMFDLNRVANDICNRDLFDDWPGASEFDN